jgi:hypothetical protein
MNAMKATKMNHNSEGINPLNRYWAFAMMLLISLSLISTYSFFSTTKTNDQSTSLLNHDSATRQRINEAFGKLPLYFVENRGQADDRVAYYIEGKDKSIWFTSEGLTYSITERADDKSGEREKLQPVALNLSGEVTSRPEKWSVKLDFIDANPKVRPVGREQTPTTFSYFKGQRQDWKRGLKTYSSVVYENLWDGIDLIYSGTVNRMKYSFVVRPGADPAQIKLAYRGASEVRVNGQGELEVHTPVGGFKDDSPVSFQEIAGRQVEVATQFKLSQNGLQPSATGDATEYGFELGQYDRTRELVIDPAVLIYCGYIGGSDSDEGNGIAIDSAGNTYITGNTRSNQDSFPVTVGPDTEFNGIGNYDPRIGDCFIAKLNAQGTALVYCGYIGGSGNDYGKAIAVDAAGNAYVAGSTNSTELAPGAFPVTVGPDTTFNNLGAPRYDAFVAKINAQGDGLDYCGYIGGSGSDVAFGLAIDGNGYAYVVGHTDSTQSNPGAFPVSGGPDLTHNGGRDGFIAKVDASGTSLNYCGYIGGSGLDDCQSVAIDRFGWAYAVGFTGSDQNSFLLSVGPDLTFNGGAEDGFVTKVSPSGSLGYSGYIGGSETDECRAVAVDNLGQVYITGKTHSNEATFPVQGQLGQFYNGGGDAFLARPAANGSALELCAYLGGSEFDQGSAIAVSASFNVYVAGVTYSSDFFTAGGPDSSFNGTSDGFITKFNTALTGISYSGFLGGADIDYINDIALDRFGNAYVTGYAKSAELPKGGRFPVLVGPDLSYNGEGDAYVAKISECEVSCPADITRDNDLNQCGAVVNFSTPQSTCGQVTCSPVSGTFFPVGATPVRCTDEANIGCTFYVIVRDAQKPALACPANIEKSNDPGLCSAVVTYTPPTVTDNCPNVGPPSCSPPSGTTFPVGAITVNCTAIDASNNVGVCSFTITVVDREPPKITCPADVTAVAPVACPRISTAVVNYPPPVVSDNCPGVTYACSPSSGSVFPVGVTKVTCTATDKGGNTATCSFNVTVFDVRVQNDANANTVLLFNSMTGDYRLCHNGMTYMGVGLVKKQGCIVALDDLQGPTRRLTARVDFSVARGEASMQMPVGTLLCTLADRDLRNNTTICQ